MGERAIRFFLDAERLGGLPAKVRLASLARVTSAEASSGPDDAALMARLTAALDRLKRELDGSSTSGVYVPPAAPVEQAGDAARLREHIASFLDLMTQRGLVLGRPDETFRRVDEVAATTLRVARVSVWLLDEARTSIVCRDLFDTRTRAHEAGTTLYEKDFGAYFAALRTERTIRADDAYTDPRTSCFSEPYLGPLGIGAMLDVPIWVAGDMVGVVCHEHIGGRRAWTADEERFAFLMSSFASLALERR